MSLSQEDFRVKRLGERKYKSPLDLSHVVGDGMANFVYDEARVLYQVAADEAGAFRCDLTMERAGPREHLYFDPSKTRAAMVTCGGLSPGLNNVLRSIFLELHHKYRINEIMGFRYGFKGMNPEHGLDPVTMTPEYVRAIHNEGGSVLGCSRGAEEPSVMVDTLLSRGINVLFCIGGDGTLKGAHAIAEEVERRSKEIAVVGVPKTIDNDIPFVYKTFGFDTAVGVVRDVLQAAHTEAVGAPNGIGMIKVMGRDSGFIAAYGTLASLEVNFCLVPEIEFDLHGKRGFLDLLEERIKRRGHAVIIVSEGAGQHLFDGAVTARDASGNILHKDIGVLLKDEIKAHFEKVGTPVSLKYIDPSYIIRSVPANASDAVFCDNLARSAVHAGMAGRTDVVIGLWHGNYVQLPMALVTTSRKKIDPESHLWRNVLGATGQPVRMRSE
jgi:6-phosphofructokinase 1